MQVKLLLFTFYLNGRLLALPCSFYRKTIWMDVGFLKPNPNRISVFYTSLLMTQYWGKNKASTWKLDWRAMYNADADPITSQITDAVIPLIDNRYILYISFLSCTVHHAT